MNQAQSRDLHILVQMKILGLPEALERGLAWQRQSGSAIVHIVSAHPDIDVDTSLKLVVNGAGESAGEFPENIHASALTAAMEALASRKSRVYSLTPTATGGDIVGMQGGEVDVFVEVLPPVLSLIIVGAGHIAQPLCVLGKLLGFSVQVIDDRPEFASGERFPDADEILVTDFVGGLESKTITQDTYVVLVTRGHVHDQACLRYVLGTEAGYIGMIGSKMRIRTVLDHLRAEGFDEPQLRRVYAPVGIDIGSHTPAEIAVAIAAEMVDVLRGGNAPHLSEQGGVRA